MLVFQPVLVPAAIPPSRANLPSLTLLRAEQ